MTNKICETCGSAIFISPYVKKHNQPRENIEICGCPNKLVDTEHNKEWIKKALDMVNFYVKKSTNDNLL